MERTLSPCSTSTPVVSCSRNGRLLQATCRTHNVALGAPLRPSYAPCKHICRALLANGGFGERPDPNASDSGPLREEAALQYNDYDAYDDDDRAGYWWYNEEELEAARAEGLAEYAALKGALLRRCQRFSAFLAVYLLLVASGEVAACSLAGGAVGYCYLLWLMRDVDAVSGEDRVGMWEAEEQPAGLARTLARVAAGYGQAAQPRLLLLLGLGAGTYYFNQQAEGWGLRPLTLVEQGALLGGFLSYKISLYLQVYEDLKPKVDPNALRRPRRPMLPEVEDVSFDLKDIMKQNKEGA